MLYVTSLGLTYFIAGTLYLLTPFTRFPHLLTRASGRHQSVLFMSSGSFLDSAKN